MVVGWAWRVTRLRPLHIRACRRSLFVSTRQNADVSKPPLQADLSRTRNIGIIAHIDAVCILLDGS